MSQVVCLQKAPATSVSLIAFDEAMRRVHRLIERVAASQLSVLILGETGVGKEVCAELVHRASERASGNLVRLNCAALPASLLESELFGYEKGAFTGAMTAKPGLLEIASGGTLFLDEIGELSRETQAKLLRALESQEILRLGATQPRRVDFRLVAATNEDLAGRVADGRFRKDLYFRINGISVRIPPLRERPSDIEPLARHFLDHYVRRSPAPTLSSEAVSWLRAHNWPGNVRQLRNLMERAAILCDGPSVEPHHFHDEHNGEIQVCGLGGEVRDLERRRITKALEDVSGSQRAAARLLGVSYGALRRRLSKLGIRAS